MTSGLTKRQREILEFIKDFINQKNYSPSFKEIGDYFGFSSLGSVYSHIQTLKKKGMLHAESSSSRSLSILEKTCKTESGLIDLPLAGYLSAGMPIETLSQIKKFKVPKDWVINESQSYILQVKGDSLIEEAIFDGDLLIVEASIEADQGDTAIVMINNHDTLVKRLFQEPPYIRLESCNPQLSPIIVRENHIEIQGIVCGLLRNYSI